MIRTRLATQWRRFWAWRGENPGRIAPFFVVTVAVMLGRFWHDGEARHRIPTVVIEILIALVMAMVGAACAMAESETVAARVLASAAAVLLFAVVGYGDSLRADLGIWFGAVVLAYVLSASHWRAERLARLQVAAETDRARIAAQAEVDVAAIHGASNAHAAEVTAAATVHAAALTSGSLDPYAAAVLVAAWADKAELGQNAPAAIVTTGAIPLVPPTPSDALSGEVLPAIEQTAPAPSASDFDAWAEQATRVAAPVSAPFPKQGVRR